jgi:2-amino-4-hydroxy-6-hydroxymethyldihydropteridine diphosphokinase
VARPEQPRFTNGVFAIATDLAPRQVKQVLSGVEAKLGRVRTSDRHAPRTMDLDLLILGDLVLDEERLRLPDPDIRRRPFIALPLSELAPELILPDTREPLSKVAAALSADGLEVDAELTALLRKRISGSSEFS